MTVNCQLSTIYPFFFKIYPVKRLKKIILLKKSMDAIIFDFLRDLKANNNREWFQANKGRYDRARQAFETFVNDLIPMIRSVDPLVDMITAKDCAFRIYRDVRFSGDKSPYKPNMGAYIARGGKNSSMAGYYVHFEPGESFLAGGLYMPPPETLKRIREDIFYQPEDFKKIIYSKEFTGCFGKLDDPDKMKNPPKGYSKDFPDIELLKFRSYAAIHKVPDHVALSADYLDYAIKVFRVLYPLNVYFNRMFA
jgi:uncharacterized protein (TIGR02453 family)